MGKRRRRREVLPEVDGRRSGRHKFWSLMVIDGSCSGRRRKEEEDGDGRKGRKKTMNDEEGRR